MPSSAPKSTQVFDNLIATLQEIRDHYVNDPQRFSDPLDVVEGYRYVGQLLSAASEMFYEADPERPRFASVISPARKLQGDNPDAIYQYARIRGDRTYRITGVVDKECYTSFTVHGEDPDGAMAGPLLGDVNDRDFEIASDGSYEVIFSADEHPGNWVKLHPDAHNILVRSYFELEVSAQNDSGVQVRIDIACLDSVGPPPPLDDSTFAERMAEGVAFLKQTTLGQPLFGSPSPAPFVAQEPNDVATPFSFRHSELPVPGAADIHYSMGRWNLSPDEALVMRGILPPGVFANVMLWNKHMQTLEYRNRRSAVNAAQLVLEPDGSYRIVIAARDPGVPNWLDTGGHREGTIFWRFLLPESDPPKPECVVVPIDQITTPNQS
ncbi:DUF1214 domain-containing protein [Myxococcota bacterium]|nr:DUF1214 domain-containing protein [Myxococcota bacterium]